MWVFSQSDVGSNFKIKKVENLDQKFYEAKIECLKSDFSVFRVGELYDIIYALEKLTNRNFNENYILAEIYRFLGNSSSALNVINASFVNLDKNETSKIKKIHNELIELESSRIKLYRDLRDAITLKEPTKLKIEDLEILKNGDNYYCFKFSSNVKNIVIFNKNFPIDKGLFFFDYFIDSCIEPDYFLLKHIFEHVEWLGQVKEELLDFYNNNFFEEKLSCVNQSWFDNLEILDFYIGIYGKDNFHTDIYLFDHIQYRYGFRVEIQNRTIKKIEYIPDL